MGRRKTATPLVLPLAVVVVFALLFLAFWILRTVVTTEWTGVIPKGEIIEVPFEIGEANENNLKAIQVKLDFSGGIFLYPFCVANDSDENAYVWIYQGTKEVVENFLVENGMRAMWQFERGSIRVDIWWENHWNIFENLSIPWDNDTVYWIVITSEGMNLRTRPITDKGELASGYALSLDFGTIGVPPRVYEAGFEEMENADDLRGEGWNVFERIQDYYIEELSFPATDRGKVLYFRTKNWSWWNKPLIQTPEWTGEAEYEFSFKLDERYLGSWYYTGFIFNGIDSENGEIWFGFCIWGSDNWGYLRSCSRYWNARWSYWVYWFEVKGWVPFNPTVWHTMKITWTGDNIITYLLDNRYCVAERSGYGMWYEDIGQFVFVQQSPVGSKFRLSLIDGLYSWWNKGSFYDFSIKQLGLPPARPIIILPSIENFHLVGEEWRANYNLILKTDPENVDNVHSFYINREQVKAILEKKTLYLKNLSGYDMTVDGVEVKVIYSQTTKVTKKGKGG